MLALFYQPHHLALDLALAVQPLKHLLEIFLLVVFADFSAYVQKMLVVVLAGLGDGLLFEGVLELG